MKKRCCYVIKNIIMTVFSIFTVFSHCLFALASNDDEYITFTNAEVMQAYRYFYLYGLRADTSYTYTDTYNTSGSISGSATFTITGSNGISIAGQSEDELHGGLYLFPTDESEFSLDINSNIMIGQIRPNDGSASTLRLSCTYSYDGQQPPGPASAVCTDPNFTDTTRYNVYLYPEAGNINITGTPATTFAHFTSADDAGEFSSTLWTEGSSTFSGSLSLHENGSLSGSGTISLTTTTTNTNNLKYILPIMSGNITNPVQNSNILDGYKYFILKDRPFVIAMLKMRGTVENFNISVDNNQVDTIGTTFNIFKRATSSTTFTGGMLIYALETRTDLSNDLYNQRVYNLFQTDNFLGGIIPLYVGYKDRMSDAMYRYIYGSDRLIEAVTNQTNIIENGNTNSQNKGQQLNTQTGQMQSQMNTFQNIEDTAGDNMNTALNNINTNPSLVSNNKFLISVDWIRQQYNRIVTNTPFEAVITFCLVLGLGLLLLGKVR